MLTETCGGKMRENGHSWTNKNESRVHKGNISMKKPTKYVENIHEAFKDV